MFGNFYLCSPRLGFRIWADDDISLALALWGDPAVTRLIGGPFSDLQIRQRLQQEINNQRICGVQYWPVFLLDNGDFVGCCGLRPHMPDERIFEIGVHLRSVHQGHGLASEALAAVIDYAFNDLRASALFAGHNPANEPSRRLLQKLGFRYTHDEYYPPTGLNHPSYLLSAAEYHSRFGAKDGD